jgi:hypothetical protein
MTSDQKPFMTPKEVVAELRRYGIDVTDDTVRNWTTRGLENKNSPELRYRLRAIRIGGRIHVFREDLVRWIPLLKDHDSPLG